MLLCQVCMDSTATQVSGWYTVCQNFLALTDIAGLQTQGPSASHSYVYPCPMTAYTLLVRFYIVLDKSN